MADFNTSFNISAQNESGYANVAGDSGGETYRGISRVYNPSWSGWKLIDAYKATNGQPARGYTDPMWDAAANSFYKVNYWDKLMGDQIKDQDLANIIYDSSLSGLPRTISLIKTVLNKKFSMDLGQGTTMDSDTIEAINIVPADQLFNEFKQARNDFFIYSAAQLAPSDSIYYSLFYQFNPNPKPSNSQFLKGWLLGVNKFAYSGISSAETVIKKNPIVIAGVVLIALTGIFFIFKNKIIKS